MNSQAPITVNAINYLHFCRLYINLFAESFNVTPKEAELISELLLERKLLIDKNLPMEFVDQTLFSSSVYKNLYQKYGYNDKLLHTYLSGLRKKKVIVKKNDSTNNSFNPVFIPKKEVTFKFNIKEND